MAPTRINDCVFIFNGGNPFSKTSDFDDDFDVKPYFNACMNLNYNRQRKFVSRGCDTDIGSNVTSLMSELRDFTNQNIKTLGQVCILGRSNGCALALALAAELNDQGINDITYVGLSDVTMWDMGRDPAVPKVGNLKPTNGPIPSGAVSPNGGWGPISESPVPQNSVPEITLSQKINALRTVNIYQIQGNHMKWSGSAKRWMWWSGLSHGEVHGKINGFDVNSEFTIPEWTFLNYDLNKHIALNTGSHWKDMCKEAAQWFAKIPSTP